MSHHLRSPVALVALAASMAVPLIGASSPVQATTTPLSVSIVGNHFVNGSGRTIRLLGVNHTSAEYGCVDGFGYDDGHFDGKDAAAIAAWGADAVRIPLNEDCWLGINGQPNSNEGADPKLTQAGYQQEIKSYVADLNAHGLYAILDLHWTAPGTQVPLEQQPMPDADHSPAFWSSVATVFKNNPAVVFDLFNEPYDPTDPRSGDDSNPNDKVSWDCWGAGTDDGTASGTPCDTTAYDENNMTTTTYRVAGMQSLVTAVRDAGAKQPVLLGGLDYANDLGESDHGQQWLTHAPDDPLNQEAASFHNYMGKGCDNATCWKDTIAPVAAHVPVVTGEFDEDNFDESSCGNKTPSTFDATYMKWADSAGVSYLAWGWIVESPSELTSDGCSAFTLIDNYSTYPPAQPNGVAVYDHLHALATAGPPPTVTLTTFHAATKPGNTKAAFTLRSPESSTGSLSGRTVHAYVVGKGPAHTIAVGTTHVALSAGKAKTVTLRLSTPAHALLVDRHLLKVRITVTLSSPHHTHAVVHHVVTLRVAHTKA